MGIRQRRFGLWRLTSDFSLSHVKEIGRLHLSDVCLRDADWLSVLLGPKLSDLWPLTSPVECRLAREDARGCLLSTSSTVRSSELSFWCLKSVLWSACSTFSCKAREPNGDLLGQRLGDEEEKGEDRGEDSPGDSEVEVGVSPVASGMNASISALSAEVGEEAGKDVSVLAVSTPESTDSERKFGPVLEDGVGHSGYVPPSFTQASMRFPKLL